ncbi:MAG: SprT family zinc-dependent metalloprotease [Cyanobacteria bacterium P01_A01_bin.135]
MTTLTFGELSFELRESARRRTIGITVERDGSLVLATPPAVPKEQLERIVEKRRFWIYSKLTKKEALQPPADSKRYLPGEGFYYIGRSYRLKLVDTAQNPLRLYQSRFELLRSQQHQGREHFTHWYRQRLKAYLQPIIASTACRIEAEPRKYQVRELGNRWGSCSSQSDIYFHWRVALLPRTIIDYVVTHEMVHLVQPGHTKAFWERVERILPDWRDRKSWLAKNGALYDL